MTEVTSFEPPPLSSETIGHIGMFDVRNTLIASWLAVAVLVAVALMLRKKGVKLVPRGFQNVIEFLIEGLFTFFDSIVQNPKQTRQFFPWVATIFLFVITANWMGILPGFGALGLHEVHEGHPVFIPLLRTTNSDINMTLAVAVISVIATQVFGIVALGFFKYFGKFFVNPIKDPIGAFVGLLELVSEVAKMVSFSFRLFGNIFAGEILLVVIGFLVPYVAPLPFLMLELFVGFVQALVFALLTLVFMKMAVTSHHDHDHASTPAHP